MSWVFPHQKMILKAAKLHRSTHEKNIKRIKAYCEKDVVTVAQLFLSLTNEPLLKDNQIIFSDTN